MPTDAEYGQEFLDWLSGLARLLAQHDRAFYDIRYEYMHMGSWVIEVGTQKRRIIVAWDGREFELSAEHAVYNPGEPRPETRRISETKMEGASHEKIFATAEGIILAN